MFFDFGFSKEFFLGREVDFFFFEVFDRNGDDESKKIKRAKIKN